MSDTLTREDLRAHWEAGGQVYGATARGRSAHRLIGWNGLTSLCGREQTTAHTEVPDGMRVCATCDRLWEKRNTEQRRWNGAHGHGALTDTELRADRHRARNWTRRAQTPVRTRVATPTRVLPARTEPGTAPAHADNPLVQAILGDLEEACIGLATVPEDWSGDPTVTGVVADPRPDRGAVYVYWVSAGSTGDTDASVPANVQVIREALTAAGWQVSTDTRGSRCAKVLLPSVPSTEGVPSEVSLRAHYRKVARACAAEREAERAGWEDAAVSLVNGTGMVQSRYGVHAHAWDADRVVVTVVGPASAREADLSCADLLRALREEEGRTVRVVPLSWGAKLAKTERTGYPFALLIQ